MTMNFANPDNINHNIFLTLDEIRSIADILSASAWPLDRIEEIAGKIVQGNPVTELGMFMNYVSNTRKGL
jgi:hypothetical protein